MKRENRVLKYREFSEIILSSPYTKSQHYVIHYRPNKQLKARIGISVSKKNGDAVQRNLIKRQIRAVIAHHFDLKLAFDIIIIVKASYDPAQFHDEETELVSLLAKIGEQH
jgi:ribonuclease P protein component